jgi:hypothetical protein
MKGELAIKARTAAAKELQKLVYQVQQNPEKIVTRDQAMRVIDGICEAVITTIETYLEEQNNAVNN